MKMVRKSNIRSRESVFIPSLCLLLVICLQMQRSNSLDPSVPNLGDIQKGKLSSSDTETNVKATLLKREFVYSVYSPDFMIPRIDADCQCSCTNKSKESCDHGPECNRANKQCTQMEGVNVNRAICSEYYKTCCQVYMKNMEKDLQHFSLKHEKTILTLNIEQSRNGKTNTINVTIGDYVKNLFLSYDKILRTESLSESLIPNGIYFIKNGSNELLYSEAIHSKGKSYKIDLDKSLQIQILDCHSNPSKYEWEVDAAHYKSNGVLHLPTDVKKVSETYKDISNIYLEGGKYKVEVVSPPNDEISLLDVNTFSFNFISRIKGSVLNLTFPKYSDFIVNITNPYWPPSRSTSFSTGYKETTLITLPSNNIDSCRVCVYKYNQQLCQIPFLVNETFLGEFVYAKSNNPSPTKETQSNGLSSTWTWLIVSGVIIFIIYIAVTMWRRITKKSSTSSTTTVDKVPIIQATRTEETTFTFTKISSEMDA